MLPVTLLAKIRMRSSTKVSIACLDGDILEMLQVFAYFNGKRPQTVIAIIIPTTSAGRKVRSRNNYPHPS